MVFRVFWCLFDCKDALNFLSFPRKNKPTFSEHFDITSLNITKHQFILTRFAHPTPFLRSDSPLEHATQKNNTWNAGTPTIHKHQLYSENSMQPQSLRAYARDLLDNLDNLQYVAPTFAPYTPPTPKLPPYFSPLHRRTPAKVYTIPAVGTPSVLSPSMRKTLDDLFDGLDDPVDEHLLTSAQTAATHISDTAAKIDVLQDIAKRNRAEVSDIRDNYKNKDLLRTPREAIDRLNELKVQEKFLIPDAMAHNMQALVSKRNQKVDGKRFKTKMIVSATPVLQVWRTR
jgi:hypothetical protein